MERILAQRRNPDYDRGNMSGFDTNQARSVACAATRHPFIALSAPNI